MAKRHRFRPFERDQIIKPDSADYGRYLEKFEKFPTNKRYRPPKSIQKRDIPKKVHKPKKIEPKREIELLEERFDKAFLISFGLIALLTPLILIPVLGPLLGLTLVPYLACNRGCRYVSKHNGVQVGFLIGLLWSIIEYYLLFQLLTQIKISVGEPGIHTNFDIAIIILIFVANIGFCMFGGYTGGKKYQRFNNDIHDDESTKTYKSPLG